MVVEVVSFALAVVVSGAVHAVGVDGLGLAPDEGRGGQGESGHGHSFAMTRGLAGQIKPSDFYTRRQIILICLQVEAPATLRRCGGRVCAHTRSRTSRYT